MASVYPVLAAFVAVDRCVMPTDVVAYQGIDDSVAAVHAALDNQDVDDQPAVDALVLAVIVDVPAEECPVVDLTVGSQIEPPNSFSKFALSTTQESIVLVRKKFTNVKRKDFMKER